MSSDRPAFRVASLASIPAISFADVEWLPLRSLLGLEAFGVNAYRAEAAGQRLMAGTCIAITETAARRTAVGLEDGTTAFAIGGPRGKAYSPTSWERAALAFETIRRGRGDEGLATLAEIVADTPGEPWCAYDWPSLDTRNGRSRSCGQ